jgi:hypothetical protein
MAGDSMTDARDELAAELHRLAGTVQDWAKRALPEPAEDVQCVPWCPICQFAHVLRTEHPDLTERLAEAGATFAAALKALADAAVPRPAQGEEAAERPRPAPRVQRIDLDEPAGD